MNTKTTADLEYEKFDSNGNVKVALGTASVVVDAEIGAVELKDGTTDARVTAKVDNAAAGTPTPLSVGGKYNATPPTYDDGDQVTNQYDASGNLKSSVTSGSIAVVAGTVNAGTINAGTITAGSIVVTVGTIAAGSIAVTAGTIAAGSIAVVAGTMNAGTINIGTITPSTYATDDSAMPATPVTFPVAGEYRSTATTYTDGDVTVMQTDINGNEKVTLATGIAGEDLTNDVLKVEERYSYYHHVGTAGSTSGTVKSGAGFLHKVNFGIHTSGGTYALYDSVGTSSSVIAIIDSGGAANPQEYNVSFATGLTVVSGSVCDLTFSYR